MRRPFPQGLQKTSPKALLLSTPPSSALLPFEQPSAAEEPGIAHSVSSPLIKSSSRGTLLCVVHCCFSRAYNSAWHIAVLVKFVQ